MKDEILLLEYNEKGGNFHHNSIYNGQLQDEPDTYDWNSIAITTEEKAMLFTYVETIKIHENYTRYQKYLTVKSVKRDWRFFCFVFNCIVKKFIENDENKFEDFHQIIREKFDMTKKLAEYGHPAYDDETTKEILDYNPLDFINSNI